MILSIVQIAAVALIALYLAWWRIGAHRRNNRTWESLLARLRHDWNARGLSEHFPWKEGLSASPDETWACIRGARGLWAMYQNARVMLEIADFAARCTNVDPELLATIRTDATQIRICALKALVQCAFSHANEEVRISAFHVASMYTGMAARMTQLLQDQATAGLPDFVAAM